MEFAESASACVVCAAMKISVDKNHSACCFFFGVPAVPKNLATARFVFFSIRKGVERVAQPFYDAFVFGMVMGVFFR